MFMSAHSEVAQRDANCLKSVSDNYPFTRYILYCFHLYTNRALMEVVSTGMFYLQNNPTQIHWIFNLVCQLSAFTV